MQQQRRADAHRCPGHGGDHRLATFQQAAHEPEHRAVEVAGRLLDEVRDVVAGGKTLVAAGNQYRLDLRISVSLLQGFAQLTVHRTGQGVFLVRAVQAQGQQAVLALYQNGVGHGESHEKKISVQPRGRNTSASS
ncbi:hypothetical protein D3C85_925420 [compost metagenome]